MKVFGQIPCSPEAHYETMNFYHKAKEASDPPQQHDLLPYHIQLQWLCCYAAPFSYSSIQAIIDTVENPKGQPSLGLNTQAATLKSMTNLCE